MHPCTFSSAHAFIECSTYVTGGNFTGLNSLPGKSLNIGYLIVEMKADGDSYVTKQKG